MNILIDTTPLPINKVGVGVYVENMLLNLLIIDDSNQYFILVQDDDEEIIKKILRISNKVKLIRVNAFFYRKLFVRMLFEQVFLPLYLIKYKIDIIHSIHYSFPLLSTAKRVVTFHDMTFYLFPEMHEKKKVYVFKKFIEYGVKKLDRILSVSKSTKKDLSRILQLSQSEADKIKVTPLGVSDNYSPIVRFNGFSELKERFLLSKEYLLFIGTLEPRKNIITLIRAYYQLKDNINKKLIIVGKKGWFYDEMFSEVEKLQLTDDVVFTGYINEKEKVLLLQNAFLFIYPSHYEGFGIPVLEALSCGVPVITSNVSSLPEVVGDAGVLLINPESVDELSGKILELCNNSVLRKELVKRGLQQAKLFTWRGCAKKTLEAYNELK